MKDMVDRHIWLSDNQQSGVYASLTDGLQLHISTKANPACPSGFKGLIWCCQFILAPCKNLAHEELGRCRASLVSPEQPVLSIPKKYIGTAVCTVILGNIIGIRPTDSVVSCA